MLLQYHSGINLLKRIYIPENWKRRPVSGLIIMGQRGELKKNETGCTIYQQKQQQQMNLQQQKSSKEISKHKQTAYRKLHLSNGNTIITYNSVNKVQPKGVFIQFTMSDTQNREQNQYVPPPFDLKQYEQEIYRKSNFRAIKALMKTFEQNKKKSNQDYMNIVGLDIKKINYMPSSTSKQKFDKSFTNRVTKMMISNNLSPELRNISSRSEKNRQTSQQSQTIPIIKSSQHKKESFYNIENEQISQKLKNMTGSTFIYRKKGSEMAPCSPSPPSKTKTKTKYLYQKLAGIQNNVRQETNLVYDKRIKSFTQLLFKLQYAHNIYINLDLKNEELGNKSRRVKCYIGPGNNSAMIKGLLKRRYWWNFSDDKNECHFVWTQIKVNSVFQKQRKAGKAVKSYRREIKQEKQEEKQVKRANKRILSPCKLAKSTVIQNFNSKVLNKQDDQSFKRYANYYQADKQRLYTFKFENVQKILREIKYEDNLIHNHLENNFYLGNKKALFYNLKQYYEIIGQNVFDILPLTFHIKKGLKDPQYKRFVAYYNKRAAQIKKQELKEEQQGILEGKKTRNIWIVKPGQNSNQGRGITVIDQIYQLNNIIKRVGNKKSQHLQQTCCSSKQQDSSNYTKQILEDEADVRTYIVQMYIDRPMLYNNRKFDIRHYMLITNIYGVTRAYWYAQGYIRTSSYEFNISNFEPEIHLTNDAVQKKYPDYGKYESYNKISYEQFQRYLDSNYSGKKYDFKKDILSKMKKMGTDAARSVFTKISPNNLMHNFEIFGLDFMIDKNFRPWLIQINTNPCLDCACPLLDRIIPYMVEQSFKLSLDVVYPPPSHYPNTCKHFAPMVNLESFKYELIFDSEEEGENLKNLYKKVKSNIMAQIGEIEEDEQFKDDGKEIKLDDFT